MSATWRRRLAAVVAGLGLAAAGTVVVLPAAFTASGNASAGAGNFVAAEEAHSRAMAWSVWEQWRPAFNRGLARYQLHRFDAAAEDFAEAASLAPDSHQCLVRLHWAWSLEAAADATDDGDARSVRYGEAGLVLSAAQCPEPEQEQQRRETAGRIEDKRGDQPAEPPPPVEPPEGREPAQNPGSDELGMREQQAQQQRRQAEDRKVTPRTDGEKTW